MNEVEENKQKKEEITSCISNIEKHRHQKDTTRLRKIICITVIYLLLLIIILIGGILANSLVIMSESAYIFSYFSGLFISLISVSVGKKPCTKVFTFGYQRAEIIGKLISIISIWLLSAFIIKEGIDRISNPTPVDAKIMFFTSIFGLVCNLIMINLLQDINNEYSQENLNSEEHKNCTNHDSKNNNEQTLNNNGQTEFSLTVNSYHENNKVKHEDQQTEFLYILIVEIIRNLLIVTSSIMINIDNKWIQSDPICSLIIMVIVLVGTLKSSKNCIDILMEATPEKYQIDRIENYLLKKYTDIINIHDFHIWSLNSLEFQATIHIVSFNKNLLGRIKESFRKKFNINRCTIQIESPEENENLINCLGKNYHIHSEDHIH